MRKLLFIPLMFIGQNVLAYHNFFFRSAEDITSGILNNNRLDHSSVTLRGQLWDATQWLFISSMNLTGSITTTGTISGVFQGNGAGITGLNAGAINVGAIRSSHVFDNSLAGSDLSADMVISSHILDNSISGTNIGSLAIVSTHTSGLASFPYVSFSTNIAPNTIIGDDISLGAVVQVSSLTSANFTTSGTIKGDGSYMQNTIGVDDGTNIGFVRAIAVTGAGSGGFSISGETATLTMLDTTGSGGVSFSPYSLVIGSSSVTGANIVGNTDQVFAAAQSTLGAKGGVVYVQGGGNIYNFVSSFTFNPRITWVFGSSATLTSTDTGKTAITLSSDTVFIGAHFKTPEGMQNWFVRLRSGSSLIDCSLDASVNNTAGTFAGRGAIVVNGSSVTVDGLKIVRYKSATNGGSPAFSIYGSTFVYVKRITNVRAEATVDAQDPLITVDGSTQVYIDDCNLNLNSFSGMILNNNAGAIRINNLKVNLTGSIGRAILYFRQDNSGNGHNGSHFISSGNFVTNSMFYLPPAFNLNVVQMDIENSGGLFGMVVQGNTVLGQGGTGVLVTESGGVNPVNVVMLGNTVSGILFNTGTFTNLQRNANFVNYDLASED